jgi:acetoacetate decarboxylase
MYLDDEPPTTRGREIWGFPKKYGEPRLKTIHDTLTGTLHYDEERCGPWHHGVQAETDGPCQDG